MSKLDKIGILFFKIWFKAKKNKQVSIGILLSLLFSLMYIGYENRSNQVVAFDSEFKIVDSLVYIRKSNKEFIHLEGTIGGREYVIYLAQKKIIESGEPLPFIGETGIARLRGYIVYKDFNGSSRFNNVKVKFFNDLEVNDVQSFSKEKRGIGLGQTEIP